MKKRVGEDLYNKRRYYQFILIAAALFFTLLMASELLLGKVILSRIGSGLRITQQSEIDHKWEQLTEQQRIIQSSQLQALSRWSESSYDHFQQDPQRIRNLLRHSGISDSLDLFLFAKEREGRVEILYGEIESFNSIFEKEQFEAERDLATEEQFSLLTRRAGNEEWHYYTAYSGETYLVTLTGLRDEMGESASRDGFLLVGIHLDRVVEQATAMIPGEIWYSDGGSSQALWRSEISLFPKEDSLYLHIEPDNAILSFAQQALYSAIAVQVAISLVLFMIIYPFFTRRYTADLQHALEFKSAELSQAHLTLEQKHRELLSELTLVHRVHQNIMPELPQNGMGLKIHGIYQPFDNYGGDIYDLTFDQRSGTLFVADVAGHGLTAALISVMVKLSFDALSSGDPGKTLTRVNEQMCRLLTNDLFLTAVYMVWRPNERLMLWSAAGQHPLLHYTAHDGEFHWVNASASPVLGVLEEHIYSSQALQLFPGDRLLIYTDGVAEQERSDGTFYGHDRLLATFRRSIHFTQNEQIAALRKDFDEFVGQAAKHDDLTLLLIEVE